VFSSFTTEPGVQTVNVLNNVLRVSVNSQSLFLS